MSVGNALRAGDPRWTLVDTIRHDVRCTSVVVHHDEPQGRRVRFTRRPDVGDQCAVGRPRRAPRGNRVGR